MIEFLRSTWPLWPAVGAFLAAAVVIGLFGSKLAGIVDRLADRTGMGEAIAGAVLLAGANSIAGMVVSVVAAASGNPSLAVSNSVGGIAAQTAFIVVVDLVYRRANLEHAAASITNVFNSMLMIVLLAVVVLGAAAPPTAFLGIHPATPLLLLIYGYGLWISRRVKEAPMWQPEHTEETRLDKSEQPVSGESMSRLWGTFALFAAIVSTAGWVVARAGLSISEVTGLSGTFVGTFFTSAATSLPELITSIAAVRAGALTLAVGGIVGGNTFDVLFIAVADGVYQQGSLYEAIVDADLFVVGWTMVLIGIVGAGLVRRQRGRVGFEGVAVLLLYLGGLATVSVMA